MPKGGFNAMQSKPPAPPTALGRLRILSPNAGVRMSALQLGGISCGDAWSEYTPGLDKEASFKLLDDFLAAGGVSIDTANGYNDGQSEEIIGEWAESRGVRDRLVIATKYTTAFQGHLIGKNESANSSGNSKKSLHISLRESLRKLRTDYIDILYIHWWDFTTSIPEIMDALDIHVKSGKVLYLGASDLPAWIISACNEYAKANNKTPFVVLQTLWNVMSRDFERDLLPMARMYNMAVVPWSALGSGKLKSEAETDRLVSEGKLDKDSAQVRTTRALLRIARSRNIDSWAPVALAYLYAKYPYVFPIVGLQNAEQLHQNIKSLEIKLTKEEVKELDDINPYDVGFPNSMNGGDPHVQGFADGNNSLQCGTIDWVVENHQYSSQVDL